jgi:hypothetical protein
LLNGGPTIEEKIEWIATKKPWFHFKQSLIFFIASLVLLITFGSVVWRDVSQKGVSIFESDISYLFFVALALTLITGLFSFLWYYTAIRAIHLNNKIIKLKYPFNRIKNIKWEQIKKLGIDVAYKSEVRFQEKNSVTVFFGDKSTIKKVVKYYEQATGRQPVSEKEFYKV